ncbi:MAG: hypothetical protein R6V17_01725 [Halanaerobacter sp.]
MLTNQNEGAVLLLTLTVMTVLSILLLNLYSLIGNEIERLQERKKLTKAFYLAEAGLKYGKSNLNNDIWESSTQDNWDEKIILKSPDHSWLEKGEIKIEFNSSKDKLRSTAVIKDKNEVRKILVEDLDLAKLMPNATGANTDHNSLEAISNKIDKSDMSYSLENKKVNTEEKVDMDLGADSTINNLKIDTEEKTDMELAKNNSMQNITIDSSDQIDLTAEKNLTMQDLSLDSPSHVKITPTENFVMQDVTINTEDQVTINDKKGKVEEEEAKMENVYIDAEGQVKITLNETTEIKNVEVHSDSQIKLNFKANTNGKNRIKNLLLSTSDQVKLNSDDNIKVKNIHIYKYNEDNETNRMDSQVELALGNNVTLKNAYIYTESQVKINKMKENSTMSEVYIDTESDIKMNAKDFSEGTDYFNTEEKNFEYLEEYQREKWTEQN